MHEWKSTFSENIDILGINNLFNWIVLGLL